MVEPNSSWPHQQFAARESPSNCMITSVEASRHENLFAQLNTTNPYWVSANQSVNGYGTSSGFPGTGPSNETHGLFGQLINQTSPIYRNQSANGLSGHVGKPSPCATSHSQQKRFLIFDHSGNETRFLFSSLYGAPAEVPVSASLKPTTTFPPHKFEVGTRAPTMERDFYPVLHEEFDENDVIVEDEIHEDTEEINALLYSDDDDSDDDDDSEDCDHSGAGNDAEEDDDDDDEVNSTGHSPSTLNCDRQEKQELGARHHDMDEVASDAQGSRKRQKVSSNARCGTSSPTDHGIPRGLSNEYNDGMYSSSCGLDGERSSPITGSKRSRRDKIHDMLRVLESIIPGTKNKDPVVVLDEAIHHLKRLKFQASKAFYSEDPESSSCC